MEVPAYCNVVGVLNDNLTPSVPLENAWAIFERTIISALSTYVSNVFVNR